MYLRSTNHWAAPITAPARAPPSAPDTTPSTDPTSTSANNPPSGKPRKVSIHHRKNLHPATLSSTLSLTTIAPHPHNLLSYGPDHLFFPFLRAFRQAAWWVARSPPTVVLLTSHR